MMCGQNVGYNRSNKASLGLWVMDKSINLISQTTIARKFLEMSLKNKNLNKNMI